MSSHQTIIIFFILDLNKSQSRYDIFALLLKSAALVMYKSGLVV
jgi:hypothetical protein